MHVSGAEKAGIVGIKQEPVISHRFFRKKTLGNTNYPSRIHIIRFIAAFVVIWEPRLYGL